MRDFLWKYFSMTGEIDAYLLYKEHEEIADRADVLLAESLLVMDKESDTVP